MKTSVDKIKINFQWNKQTKKLQEILSTNMFTKKKKKKFYTFE